MQNARLKLCGLIENAQIRLFLFSWFSDSTTCQHHPHMGKWDLADHINWALKWEGAEEQEDPSLQICHLLLPRLSPLPHRWSSWNSHRSLWCSVPSLSLQNPMLTTLRLCPSSSAGMGAWTEEGRKERGKEWGGMVRASERLLLNHAKTLGSWAPEGEEFNSGPETRLSDRARSFCVIKFYWSIKWDRENFDIDVNSG